MIIIASIDFVIINGTNFFLLQKYTQVKNNNGQKICDGNKCTTRDLGPSALSAQTGPHDSANYDPHLTVNAHGGDKQVT